MFRTGYSIARNYTRPVVLSRRSIGGNCSAMVGTMVVLNDEGWILTAWHIVEKCIELKADMVATKAHYAEVDRIRADATLASRDRQKALQGLGKLRADATSDYSSWWGGDGVELTQIVGLKNVDLAIGKLDPFDAASVSTYPVLKDPTKDFEPGTSLCKMGFPFHSIDPIWHTDKQAFELPAGTLPMPLFPIEGIFTRYIDATPAANPYGFRQMFLETSSPGLMGQSGGPTFDTQGSIWAIQSQTIHHFLGFQGDNNKLGPKTKEHLEHQFLNVGLGVHVETIIGLLGQIGVRFQLSAY